MADSVVICRALGHSAHIKASAKVENIYNKMGYQVSFKDVPNKRSLVETERANCFGEVGRIKGVLKNFPSLRQSAYPIHTIQAFAYGLEDAEKISNWLDLSEFRVGVARGELYAEKNLVHAPTIVAGSYDSLVLALREKRVDYIVALSDGMEGYAGDGKKIMPMSPAIFESHLYHLVHETHQDALYEFDEILAIQH
ncbi:MAG: hypothetical protein R3261_02640 [Alphaproteobacteria bacterium]|nr:hypothetical protein [Alphaproteobacteria bacterium]